MAPVVVLAPPGNWGLLLRSCLRVPLASPRLGGAEDEGESWEAPPLPSVAGGRETTMYFWTLPEMGGLGAACPPETNFTRGCVLATVLVTGEVEVLAWPPLSVITCESKRRSEKSLPARLPPPPPPPPPTYLLGSRGARGRRHDNEFGGRRRGLRWGGRPG